MVLGQVVVAVVVVGAVLYTFVSRLLNTESKWHEFREKRQLELSRWLRLLVVVVDGAAADFGWQLLQSVCLLFIAAASNTVDCRLY